MGGGKGKSGRKAGAKAKTKAVAAQRSQTVAAQQKAETKKQESKKPTTDRHGFPLQNRQYGKLDYSDSDVATYTKTNQNITGELFERMTTGSSYRRDIIDAAAKKLKARRADIDLEKDGSMVVWRYDRKGNPTSKDFFNLSIKGNVVSKVKKSKNWETKKETFKLDHQFVMDAKYKFEFGGSNRY